jgi:hypothetical protein
VLAIIKMQCNAKISFSQKLYTCTVKRLFRQELQAPERGIPRKNGIPLGIARSLTWKSTGGMEFRRDYWLIDMDSGRQDQKFSDQ